MARVKDDDDDDNVKLVLVEQSNSKIKKE